MNFKHKVSNQVISQADHAKLSELDHSKDNFEETEDEATHTLNAENLMVVLEAYASTASGEIDATLPETLDAGSSEGDVIGDGGTGEWGGASSEY